jgi:hypothetical protein
VVLSQHTLRWHLLQGLTIARRCNGEVAGTLPALPHDSEHRAVTDPSNQLPRSTAPIALLGHLCRRCSSRCATLPSCKHTSPPRPLHAHAAQKRAWTVKACRPGAWGLHLAHVQQVNEVVYSFAFSRRCRRGLDFRHMLEIRDVSGRRARPLVQKDSGEGTTGKRALQPAASRSERRSPISFDTSLQRAPRPRTRDTGVTGVV